MTNPNAMLIEECARAAHTVNRAYCTQLGDLSQPPWEEAPEWQKNSARLGAIAVLNDPDWNPRSSHESWLEQKRREGWTYGDVKDADAKTHPCFMPFESLPVSQQAKDAIFVAVVREVARTRAALAAAVE